MDQNLVHHQISNYKVNVPVFEGPLDLLLQLIEHSDLDITTISLAMVTDQYLDYIHQMSNIAAEEISEFLVIAAKLIQIKSEALLPRPVARSVDDEDPGISLIHQLQIYKQFKDISLWLQDREIKGLQTFLRIAPPPKIEEHLDLSDLTLETLIFAAQGVLLKEEQKQNLDSVIKAPKITIREKIALIARYLNKEKTTSFNEVLGKSASRLEIVVTFLALLELIKKYRVSAYQETLFSDIQLKPLIEFAENEEFDVEFGE